MAPKYLLRMRKRGGYGENFGQRFGRGVSLPAKQLGERRIWIQAVSLGEMLAIEPLLRGLVAERRNRIFLTVTTSTGYALAKEKYGDFALGIAYFPLDFWPFSRRVWNAVEPDLAICAETELWPEHLRQAARRKVPFVLVNGRLSDKSFRSTQKLAWLVGSSLRQIDKVFACSDLDAARFVALGLGKDRVETVGNLKVDVEIDPILTAAERAELKRCCGLGNGFVLLGSSTWPGEEAALLEAFKALRTRDKNARLLIVPRHGERREEIRSFLAGAAGGLRFHFKSRGLPALEVDILVADTHGELRALTQIADLAFIGKSLPPHSEGQTPVEAGALGVPMLIGPGMSNFRSIRAGLKEVGAFREVADGEALTQAVLALSSDETLRARMGEAGRAWHAANQGAVGRTLEGIEALFAPR